MKEDGVAQIPYFVHEGELARAERSQRLCLAVALASAGALMIQTVSLLIRKH